MTKKGFFGSLSKSDAEDARRAGTQQDGGASLNKQTMQTRVPSAKKLPAVDESMTQNSAVVGKFSETEHKEDSESEEQDDFVPSIPTRPANELRSSVRSTGLLTRAESDRSLRRGTPRPSELKKTLSTVKFVLENSGLDQVQEEDMEMV